MLRKPRQRAGDYEVGYGKPPAHSRFRPGQSGNPRGRPRDSANFRTLMERALAEKVAVKEGGRRRMISKGEAIITQLVNKAAGADLPAMKLLLSLLLQRGREEGGEAPDQQRGRADAHQPPAASEPDYDNMTTKELETLYEAALILEGKKERPSVPVPPSGPKPREEDE